jgi:pimeloyl-ACP methyl ester carboxylesterase
MVNSHYRLGNGPRRVIALHGWFGDHRAFAPVWPYLDLASFSYAFMDYRGYGGARSLSGQHTMDEIARDTLDLADALGWQRFSLVGHSMGGKAIQRVLVEAPDRVEKLVGINPVPASGVPLDEQGWALFSGAADNPDNRRVIIDFSTGNRLTSVWLDQMVATSLATSTRDAFADYLEAWAHGDFHERVVGKPVPVQVIVGAHDAALTADVMRATWLEWYPNAVLEVMPDAGHYPMDETPIALATLIERFLAS